MANSTDKKSAYKYKHIHEITSYDSDTWSWKDRGFFMSILGDGPDQ